MNYNHTHKNDSSATTIVACAVVFLAFCFLWLYCFQADVMYLTQHVLSDGQTQYHRLWGAVLITALLQLLQLGLFSVLRLRRRTHALTYFPSMLFLAVLSSANADIDLHFSLGHWYWLVPLLLLLWGGVVGLAKYVQHYEQQAAPGFFSRRTWINLFTMMLMMCGVGLSANTNAVFHFRTHAEVAMLQGDFDEALRVGNRSLETDGSLMMLRMYALSRKGQLPERLFAYPLVPTSDDMLPTADAVRLQVYPSDSLYRHLGAIPRRPMRPMEYLHTILRSHQAKPAATDYLLCGYLIDRDLDTFARELVRRYTVNDSLPRYYREALVLYTHQRSQPHIVYHDPVLDVDYKDFRALSASCTDANERRGKLLEHYADSYWFYYAFPE